MTWIAPNPQPSTPKGAYHGLTVNGAAMKREQADLIRTIVKEVRATSKATDVHRTEVAAVAAAMVQTNVRNVPAGDDDSRQAGAGVLYLTQRQGGPVADRMDPARSTRSFVAIADALAKDQPQATAGELASHTLGNQGAFGTRISQRIDSLTPEVEAAIADLGSSLEGPAKSSATSSRRDRTPID